MTLAAPVERELMVDDVRVTPLGATDSAVVELARHHDAVFAQQLSIPVMRALARSQVRVVYDLYVPFLSESLGLLAGETAPPRVLARRFRVAQLAYRASLLFGDAFACASERQRDLWLGALGELGRIDVAEYRHDATLRSLIDVVPFGLDDRPPPVSARHGLRGVVPGIHETDHVLLWGGGIWNWFDPLTVIEAVARIAHERSDVKLYFLGTRHPSPRVPAMAMTNSAIGLARERGLEGSTVFFNFGWTPFDDRVAVLLDSDLGVSAHFDSLETRFAFRTRLLDYFWAGLPTVTTAGDVLGDLVAERGLGRTVAAGDVDGWVDAIVGLLADPEARRTARANVEAVRPALSWARAAETLERILMAPPRPHVLPSGTRTLRVRHGLATVGSAIAEHGALETSRRALRAARRRPRAPGLSADGER